MDSCPHDEVGQNADSSFACLKCGAELDPCAEAVIACLGDTPEPVGPGFRAMMPWLLVGGVCTWALLVISAFHIDIAAKEWRYRRGTERLELAVRDERHGWLPVWASTSTTATVSAIELKRADDRRWRIRVKARAW